MKGTEKQAALRLAESDIIYTTRLKPDMGGEEMRKKYDKLLRDIQKSLGQQVTGLPQPKPTATAPKTGAPSAATPKTGTPATATSSSVPSNGAAVGAPSKLLLQSQWGFE